MNNKSFTIWCNNDFAPEQESERALLISGVGGHRLLMFEPDHDGQNAESRAALRIADIAFGYPDAHAVSNCERLHWIHLNIAGYASFDYTEIRQTLTEHGIVLTNSSTVFAEPCAQHLLAMISGLARGLPQALGNQRADKSWQVSALGHSMRLLNEQTVLILGFGAIAQRLVELLRPLEMNLIAVRREIKGNEPIPVVTASGVDDFLPRTDHLVNTLPANEQTANFLNAERLARLKPGAIVYNIGRGTTLDQNALLQELRAGRVAAAYLDVTDPEPLPPDHPLWETANCFITPHIGGRHDTEKERQIKHFLDNLHRFEHGEVLRNRII